jgi:predicted component of viral defense system (DUF524 family)
MTRKVYKSAMGKTVDLGALLLQNETVRAVGNMHVNARGDLIDGSNSVIDQKNRQVQRHYSRQSVKTQEPQQVKNTIKATNTVEVKKIREQMANQLAELQDDVVDIMQEQNSSQTELPQDTPTAIESAPPGGLAAAIARTREVKQELEKTRRQQAQEAALKKI